MPSIKLNLESVCLKQTESCALWLISQLSCKIKDFHSNFEVYSILFYYKSFARSEIVLAIVSQEYLFVFIVFIRFWETSDNASKHYFFYFYQKMVSYFLIKFD